MHRSSHCLLCGHKNTNPTQAEFSSQVEDESVTIITEVEHLQNIIDRLAGQRAMLLQRLNIQKSATGRLPTEILSTIFLLACQRPDFPAVPSLFIDDDDTLDNNSTTADTDPASPLLLSAVSSRWRRVVNSMPRLWTSFQAEVRNGNVNQVVSRLQHYLTYSRTLGTTVELDLDGQMFLNISRMNQPDFQIPHDYDYDSLSWSMSTELALEPLRRALFVEHPKNIRALRLASPPPEWFGPHIQWQKLGQLESIYLSWGVRGNGNTFLPDMYPDFLSATTLQKLWLCRLSHFTITHGLQIHNGITELHLSCIDYTACINALVECEHLRSCSMLYPTYNSQGQGIEHLNVVEMKNLETLEWTFPHDSPASYEINDLLPSLFIPSIINLTLHDIFLKRNGESPPGLEQFLERLPLSCKLVHFYVTTHFLHQPVNDFIQRIPSTVADIKFSSPCYGFASALMNNTSDFTISISGVNRSIKESHPFLHCYMQSLGTCEGSWFTFPEFLGAMKERSRTRSTCMLRLEYETELFVFDWSDIAGKQQLRELIDAGLRLEIVENGKLVRW